MGRLTQIPMPFKKQKRNTLNAMPSIRVGHQDMVPCPVYPLAIPISLPLEVPSNLVCTSLQTRDSPTLHHWGWQASPSRPFCLVWSIWERGVLRHPTSSLDQPMLMVG